MFKEIQVELTTLDLVVKGMLEKKAEDVVILDLSNISTAVTDYFVICSANSDTQVDAISHAVQEEIWKAKRIHPYGKEGFQQKEWILLDFGDVVAHIFRRDRREFYALEELWGDAIVVEADEEFEKALYRRLAGEPEEIKKSVEEIKVIKLAENPDAKKKVTKKASATASKSTRKSSVKVSSTKKKTAPAKTKTKSSSVSKPKAKSTAKAKKKVASGTSSTKKSATVAKKKTTVAAGKTKASKVSKAKVTKSTKASSKTGTAKAKKSASSVKATKKASATKKTSSTPKKAVKVVKKSSATAKKKTASKTSKKK